MAGATNDQEQPGIVVSPRGPIGGLRGRRPGPLDALLYPFQPQRAWLQGAASHRPVRGIVRQLNRMADDQDMRSQPLDWSFRTDPQGLRKKQELR